MVEVLGCLGFKEGLGVSQTPGRIQKVDPLIWGPILLRVLYTTKGILRVLYRNPH